MSVPKIQGSNPNSNYASTSKNAASSTSVNTNADPAKTAARQEELAAKITEAMGNVDLKGQIEGPGHQLFDQYFQWSDFTQ